MQLLSQWTLYDHIISDTIKKVFLASAFPERPESAHSFQGHFKFRYSLHQHFLNQHIPYKAILLLWHSSFLRINSPPGSDHWISMWTGAAVNWWQFTQALCSGKDSKPLRSFCQAVAVTYVQEHVQERLVSTIRMYHVCTIATPCEQLVTILVSFYRNPPLGHSMHQSNCYPLSTRDPFLVMPV